MSFFRPNSNQNSLSFNIDKKYELLSIIGSGAYGIVAAARDTSSGSMIAVKKIRGMSNQLTAKRTLRELQIMSHLSHPNLLGIYDIQLPGSRGFSEVYLMTELMDCDLSRVIKSPQVLTKDYVVYFMYQLLRGLECMHAAKIVHRDIKPSNILVNSQCTLKICDFGLARDCSNIVSATQMTDYVSTRWYRSPEVLMKNGNYSTAMDIWSAGCVFAELILRKPLMPGKDAQSQLVLIKELLEQQGIDLLLGNFEPHALDLVKKMLVFEPHSRITAAEALNHPFFSRFHRDNTHTLQHCEFRTKVNNNCEAKKMLYDEIVMYHLRKNGKA